MIDEVMAIAAPLARTYGINKAIEIAYGKLGLDVPTQSEIDALTGGGINQAFAPTSLANTFKRGALNLGIRSLAKSIPTGPLAALGITAFIGNKFNPMNPNAVNYSPNLRGQIDFLSKQPGMIGINPNTGLAVYGPNSVLAGKNVSSMFGTNNYQQALDNRIGYFDKQKEKKGFLTELQQKKLDEAKTEKKDFFDFRAEVRDTAKTKSGLGSFRGPTGKDVHGNDSDDDDGGGESGFGGFCFDPNTLVQMVDGSEKKIKEIQLGDQTKGGEVTGVFQFKASDEIHDYKGVVVAGSHYVKENGKFIMVQDSPISVKIDKIPVVYSLDTTGRRIFIKDIEFADYNGDGVAKGFLVNAGINVPEFNKEVLRQVEKRLI